MENVRTVVFMADQRGLAEDLYRCKETGKVYIRQECQSEDHVRWLTASKWTGGYEADSPMKEGLTMKVVDKDGKELFVEKLIKREGDIGTWAVKEGPFSWEAIRGFAAEMERQYGLHTYEQWKAWLLADRPEGSKIGNDNWMYGMVDRGPVKTLARLDFLGMTVYATSQEEKHTASQKSWTCFEIRDSELETCLAVSGFKYEEVQ